MPSVLTADAYVAAVERIGAAPAALTHAVSGLSDSQLDTPYRVAGWTSRQVVHHLPDSHMNAYVRMKLALTEKEPLIRTYEEARWAVLPDSSAPVSISLELLAALHRRWVMLFTSLDAQQRAAPFRHPDLGTMNVAQLAALYAWHGEHHVAHITSLRTREGW